ncbi:MAG: type IV pilus twitching motility protein PilT [Oligosphaeraceae bacterium]|nr:type IV pilus twitching motility protein PilT [Oligosphaeraceae bacterium]
MLHLDDLLRQMIELGGSDLHLCSTMTPKIRLHGNLVPLPERDPIPPEEMLRILEEVAPPVRWEWYVKNWDMDYAYEIKGLARFRVNYLNNYYGPAAVMRVIPTKIMSIDALKLPPILRNICENKNGLVLVTGPTGSGKSTTLAAMIDYINDTQDKHIITIEDPIEFVHPNKHSVIVQREVGPDTKSFGTALRGAMRADPDIILVGEMRDQETINLALTCATMGILVFGTLHTNNAPKTIDRIIDSFPCDQQPQIRAMLAQSLAAVVSQLLCRTASGKGRVACHEVLLRNEGLPATIREGAIANIRSIIEQSSGAGMQSMDNTLMKLFKEGKITSLEAYLKSLNKIEFEKILTPEDKESLRG